MERMDTDEVRPPRCRYESYGWHTQYVSDGTDTAAILNALENAKAETGKPSMIKVKTVIGHGSQKQVGSVACQGSIFCTHTPRLGISLAWLSFRLGHLTLLSRTLD